MRFVLTLAATALLVAGCKSKDKHHDSAKSTPPAAAGDKKATKDKDAKKGAHAEAAASSSKVECKNGGDVRTLEVRGKDKGCETAYTKSGQENVVGSSQNGMSHCEGIMNRIKDKLAASGFTCQ